jgi:hypothetical protein
MSETCRLRETRIARLKGVGHQPRFADPGQIQLPVREGFSSNRRGFIRNFFGNQIAQHGDTMHQIAVRKSVDLGQRTVTRDDPAAEQAADETLEIPVPVLS